MKFTAVLSLLAATALAAPAELGARSSGSCNNNQKQVCCNGLLLNCLVQILGGTCDGGAYCCSTTAPVGALINIQALNCLHL